MKKIPQYLVLICLSLCSSSTFSAEIEDEIAELRESIKALKTDMGDVVKLRENIQMSEKEVAAAKLELSAIEEEVKELETMRNVYRSAFRVVSPVAKGTALGDIRLNDGSVVSGAVLVNVSGMGISVQSANGPRNIGPELLSAEMRSQFALPESADKTVLSYAKLKEMKPAAAKGRSEIMAEADAKRRAESLAKTAAAEAAKNSSATILSTGSGDLEYDDYKKVQARKTEDLKALRRQYHALAGELTKAKRAKHDQVNEFYRSNIKVAKYEQDKVLASHDRRIDALNKQKEAVWNQISVIQEQ